MIAPYKRTKNAFDMIKDSIYGGDITNMADVFGR